MSIPRILFFTLLVILAITEIHSSPAGGKGSKSPESPGGKKTADENVRDINERRVSEDIHGNSAINSQIVNKQVDAVSGDEGYIPPNSAGPSESNPSHGYRVDSPIHSTNPLSDALSPTHLGNKPETLTQLSEKRTSSLPAKPSDINNKADDSKVLGPLSESISGKIFEDFIIPDIISYGNRRQGRCEHWIVPDEIRNDPERFQEAFMTMLPEHGFYRELFTTGEYSAYKQIETTRMIIKMRNPQKYEFVAPEKILFAVAPFSFEVPKNVKLSAEQYQKWLDEILPKGPRSYTEFYETGFSIEYSESGAVSSQSAENKKNGVATEAKTLSEFIHLIENMKKSLKEYEGGKKDDPETLKQTPGYRRDDLIPDTINMINNFDNSLVELNIPEIMKSNPELYDSWFVKEMPDRGIYADYRRDKPDEGVIFKKIESMKILMKIKNPQRYGFIAPETVVVITDTSGKNMFSFNVPKEAKKSVVQYMKWLRRIVSKGNKHREIYEGNVIFYHPDHFGDMEKSHEGGKIQRNTEKDPSFLMKIKNIVPEASKSSPISGSSDKVEKGHEAKKVDPIISSSI